MSDKRLSREDFLNGIMSCTCDVAYKSRGLAAPDCAYCNYSDDIINIMGEFAEREIYGLLDWMLTPNPDFKISSGDRCFYVNGSERSYRELYELYKNYKP